MASLVDDRLLDAVARAESNNLSEAVGDRGKAIGAYQMQPIAYKDVQRIYPQEFGKIPYARLKTDATLQRRAAQAYLRAGETTYGIKDLDRLIAFYNAGPRVRTGPIPNQWYIDRVKVRLKGGGMSPNPKGKTPGPGSALPQPPQGGATERGIRRINTMATAFGLQPLGVQEIKGMLNQHAPLRPINGLAPKTPQQLAQERQTVPGALAMGGGMRQPQSMGALGGMV